MSKQTDLINIPDAITVDGSNVGIGTSSPEGQLHVYSSSVGAPSADANDLVIEKTGDTGLSILSTTTGRIYFGDAASNDQGSIRYVHPDNSMRFETDSSERMRIDSSGNLLVGKTVQSIGTDGVTIVNGQITATADGADAIRLNRKTSDGSIIDFRKDGSTVGSIASNNGDRLAIGSSDTGLLFVQDADDIIPFNMSTGSGRDNAIDLGQSGNRFKDAYLSGGVYLGGTGSSNHLRHYESGSWTPVFSSGSAGTYTYVEQQGKYVRVGDVVTVWFNLTNITTVSGGTGLVRITGLPFTVNWPSGFNGEGIGTVGVQGFTGIDGKYISPKLQDGVDYITLYHSTGTNNNMDTIDVQDKVDNSSDIRGCATYYIGG